ncbi:MAG TPA: gluconate 2-dehydrogenase subunit 3 family protein [Puia sp.]|nr:gluconate 2-dehydrogenase subunit 3 family protein [Puia sp.]
MDRRNSIKTIIVGAVSGSVLVEACESKDPVKTVNTPAKEEEDVTRMPEELQHLEELKGKEFFTADEKATLVILTDIIIPRDEVSGSASDARVVDFLSFIVLDKPEHQTPLRGGLRWLDLRALNKFEKPFKDLSGKQQLEIVDTIAYPKKAKPEDMQGVHFFTLLRNLTITGFYTTETGFKDIGYVGNRPNQWNGVPAEVLREHGLSYTEKELKECISFT